MSKTRNGTNFSVQDLIDELNKVEDKSRGLTLYASTDNPNTRGVLEIYGWVFDVDTEVLKGDKHCDDVVINASATDFQVSNGFEESESGEDKEDKNNSDTKYDC